MHRDQGRNGLHLHDKGVSDQQIHPKPQRHGPASVHDWHGNLGPMRNAGVLKLDAQALQVQGFEQPRTQGAMHRDRRPYDAP